MISWVSFIILERTCINSDDLMGFIYDLMVFFGILADFIVGMIGG